jgi:hypothetical protein
MVSGCGMMVTRACVGLDSTSVRCFSQYFVGIRFGGKRPYLILRAKKNHVPVTHLFELLRK